MKGLVKIYLEVSNCHSEYLGKYPVSMTTCLGIQWELTEIQFRNPSRNFRVHFYENEIILKNAILGHGV